MRKLKPIEENKSEKAKIEIIIADKTGATKMISYNEIINKKLDNFNQPSLLLLDVMSKGTHIIATLRSKGIIASKYLLYYYRYITIHSQFDPFHCAMFQQHDLVDCKIYVLTLKSVLTKFYNRGLESK